MTRWTARAKSLRAAVRAVTVKLANRRAARSFAAECAADDERADLQVLVHFADGPENLYQLASWTRLLEQSTHRVGVLVTRPDTGRAVRGLTHLPVIFAPGSAELETVVGRHRPHAVLYVNHKDLNFRMLRFVGPVHVFLGHGESDKDYSTSHQTKAYDLTWIAGQASADRLRRRVRGYDVARWTRQIGRPQLDLAHPGAPDWPDDGTTRVLYAPTWEGDRPSMAYGSVASHGPVLIAALVADPRFRIIYRPHPRVGLHSSATAAADRTIRGLLRSGRDLVDSGPYGWQWDAADVCIADLSAVAYDWLATGKPMVVTTPADPRVGLDESPLLAAVPRLEASSAGRIVTRIDEVLAGEVPADDVSDLSTLSAYYFGDTSPGASLTRFTAALDEAVSWGASPPGSPAPDQEA